MVVAEPRLRPLAFLPMRLLEQIDVDDSSSCLLWTGEVNDMGYPRVWDGERLVFIYRWVVEAVTECPIPKGMQVGHDCHDQELSCPSASYWSSWCWHRRCVEPSHLTLRTARENILASPRTVASRRKRAAQNRPKRPFPWRPPTEAERAEHETYLQVLNSIAHGELS